VKFIQGFKEYIDNLSESNKIMSWELEFFINVHVGFMNLFVLALPGEVRNQRNLN
jgi:hypothetical protein